MLRSVLSLAVLFVPPSLVVAATYYLFHLSWWALLPVFAMSLFGWVDARRGLRHRS
jgi:putative effector of murein hydrolase LrgA (UPF0299 family)